MCKINPFLEVACCQAAKVGSVFEWRPLPFPLAYLDKRGRQIEPLPPGTPVKAGPLTFTPAGLLWWLNIKSRSGGKVAVLFSLQMMKSWPNIEEENNDH